MLGLCLVNTYVFLSAISQISLKMKLEMKKSVIKMKTYDTVMQISVKSP